MVKLNFKFDLEKDLWNIWHSCQKHGDSDDISSIMPSDIVKMSRGKDEKKAKKEIYNYYKKIYDSGFIEIYLSAVKKAWKKIEKRYFRQLEKMTGKKIKLKKIDIYVTLSWRCPAVYDKIMHEGNWFMIPFWYSLHQSLEVIGHELLHFHFFDNYWESVVKELGEKKAWEFKEIFTVLLNEKEFNQLWFCPDEGYKDFELREYASKEWKKKKDFDGLVSKLIIKIK